ncbi:MAG: hypothetical protein KF844_08475, partial [Cryobacterium sp.]|nr:hypothetical protein [Cryobacterium sp.]
MRLKLLSTERVIEALGSFQGKQLNLLRDEVRSRLNRRPDDKLRLAFAEHYRTQGVRSEAARWGITVPGWSTPEEILSLRHWLLGRFEHHDEIRERLCLPFDKPLPQEVADLTDPAFRERGQTPVPEAKGGCAALIVIAIASLFAFASLLTSGYKWIP